MNKKAFNKSRAENANPYPKYIFTAVRKKKNHCSFYESVHCSVL